MYVRARLLLFESRSELNLKPTLYKPPTSPCEKQNPRVPILSMGLAFPAR